MNMEFRLNPEKSCTPYPFYYPQVKRNKGDKWQDLFQEGSDVVITKGEKRCGFAEMRHAQAVIDLFKMQESCNTL